MSQLSSPSGPQRPEPTGQASGAEPAWAGAGRMPAAYEPMDDEIDLIDLVKVIWRSRWLIIGLTLLAVVAAAAFTLTRERMYESSAVFAVQTEGLGPALTAGNQQGTRYTVGMLTTLLKSRELAERVLEAENLTTRWGLPERFDALKRLQNRLKVSANDRDQVITVSFSDPDPVLARDVVAAYVEHFVEMANEINVTAEDQMLAFIEERLSEVEQQLAEAEQNLRDFQVRYQITSLEDQTQQLVAAYGQVQDRIRLLNVELTGKLSYLGERSPEVREMQNRLEELHRQLTVLEGGGRVIRTDLLEGRIDVGEVMVTAFGLQDIPDLRLQLAQLEREARAQRDLYQLLRQRREVARIEASRKLNIAQVIDPPRVPEQPLSRRFVLNVAIAGFLGVFVSMMLAFILEYFRSREWDEATLKELPFIAALKRG